VLLPDLMTANHNRIWPVPAPKKTHSTKHNIL